MKHYLLIIYNDHTPHIDGPFDNVEQRNNTAFDHFRERGQRDGVFMLDQDDSPDRPALLVHSYSTKFTDRAQGIG